MNPQFDAFQRIALKDLPALMEDANTKTTEHSGAFVQRDGWVTSAIQSAVWIVENTENV
jgi:hypothetical protein